NKVIYDSILSDYQVDHGKSVARIYPLEQDKPTKATAPLATKTTKTTETKSKGINATIIIGDFSKGKPS
ncbi:outer membrane protein assembly factor BamB, partial [Francisella tularensis subsp. holarctica]|nr:outer membrane protein assembly factor BamB [Francisella tularensis subsp. holarctica]